MTDRTATYDFQRFGNDVFAAGRQVWLAGLGAAAEAREEGKRLLDTLVERGKRFEKTEIRPREERLGKRVDTFRGKLEENVESFRGKLGETVEEVVTTTMKRLGVPTREDVETLRVRLDTLSKKLESVTAGR